MTSPTETREAVARTWNETRSRYVIYCSIFGNTPAKLWLDKESTTAPVFVGPVDECEARIDLAAADAIIADHIAPRDAEIESLRARAEAAEAALAESERQGVVMREALAWIADRWPATCDMTIAHEMADCAHRALTLKEPTDAHR